MSITNNPYQREVAMLVRTYVSALAKQMPPTPAPSLVPCETTIKSETNSGVDLWFLGRGVISSVR